jgi:MerR family redox-sensitive transcriptional activator SoxR
MSDVTIGRVAAVAGVATSAIRFWEEEGLLERARRRSGRRVYDEAIHDRVGLILLAQRAGFTIPEIRTLLRGFPPRASAGERWRALVDRKQAEVRGKIEELRRMLEVLERLERCECPDLDACGATVRQRRPRRRHQL